MIPDRETTILRSRFRKAERLVETLRLGGMMRDDLTHMSDAAWALVATATGDKVPGVMTRVMVELLMERDEK